MLGVCIGSVGVGKASTLPPTEAISAPPLPSNWRRQSRAEASESVDKERSWKDDPKASDLEERSGKESFSSIGVKSGYYSMLLILCFFCIE